MSSTAANSFCARKSPSGSDTSGFSASANPGRKQNNESATLAFREPLRAFVLLDDFLNILVNVVRELPFFARSSRRVKLPRGQVISAIDANNMHCAIIKLDGRGIESRYCGLRNR